MKKYQLQVIALGLLLVIEFISATAVEANDENKELININCTVLSQNMTLVNQEEVEDPEPSEEFKAEIQQQFKLLKSNISVYDREKRHTYHRGYIYHGNNIALQSSVRYLWLGCFHHCGTYPCPGMYFEGTDWTSRCVGEVFRIYRMGGPGHVRVGDYVGLYFPIHKRWFGCPHPNCGKLTCPGSPSWRYGFSSRYKWHRCGGEVFRIYAKNKGTGSLLYAHDDVMFYAVAYRQWVSLLANQTAKKRSCPGSYLPPPASKYDRCGGEVFNINKQ